MPYLITHSLISSWNYLYSCYESAYDSAWESFMKTLNREPTEVTEEMHNGLVFEDLVYKIASYKREPISLNNGEYGLALGDCIEPLGNKWISGANEVAKYLYDAQTQVKLSTTMTVDGIDLFVYGILDGLKEGVIYDVKFSNKSFHSADLAGKYLDSSQHPTYFALCPEATKFVYLVSDGEDVYTEVYTPKITRPFAEIASEFLTSLKVMNLLDVYKEKWLTKAS